MGRAKEQKIGTFGLIRNESGQIFFLQRAMSQKHAARWELPGGLLRFGEHPDRAVVREVKEETGLIVEPSGVYKVINHFSKKHRVQQVRIVYRCEMTGPVQEVRLNKHHMNGGWFEPDEIELMVKTRFTGKIFNRNNS